MVADSTISHALTLNQAHEFDRLSMKIAVGMIDLIIKATDYSVRPQVTAEDMATLSAMVDFYDRDGQGPSKAHRQDMIARVRAAVSSEAEIPPEIAERIKAYRDSSAAMAAEYVKRVKQALEIVDRYGVKLADRKRYLQMIADGERALNPEGAAA